jgi:hypothetical protein
MDNAMELRHVLAMIAGKWVKDLALSLGLDRVLAMLAGMVAGAVVTKAIAAA